MMPRETTEPHDAVPQKRKRTFVFLQGLASQFFDQLGKTLAGRGHDVVRVNFNAGDRAFWRQKGAIDYRGRPEDWPAYFAALVSRLRITDLVLFGDCRPMHRAAIGIAEALCLPVHVVEEGYLRPDWVTIELGGVNGHSNLSRDPAWYREAAVGLPAVETIKAIPSSFARRAREDLLYNFSAMLLWPLFPHYQSHRPWHPIIEYLGWARRLLHGPAARRRSAAMLKRLHDGAPYFLFPLQLDCDSQIRLHSSFTGMSAAIETVLTSFASDAGPEAVLVVKEHPLDNGLTNWRRLTLGIAERLGLLERLVYLEDGDIATLVREAAGVVTVNSTTGTLALASGVPVITLGSAIYDLRGLTFQGELGAFWSDPAAPDAVLFDAFRRVLIQRCLVRGGFFSDAGIDLLVQGAIERLEAAVPAPSLPGRERVLQAATSGPVGYPAAAAVASLRR